MSLQDLSPLLPEAILCLGLLLVFLSTLGEKATALPRHLTLLTLAATAAACLWAWNQHGVFLDTYAVDSLSRALQTAITLGLMVIVLLGDRLPDIKENVHAEYHLMLLFHLLGLFVLVGSIDAITLVIALECSSFPLFILVAMRRERQGQRVQMESAIKYMMFGIVATGLLLFGLGHLYGLAGTTHLRPMAEALSGQMETPLVLFALLLVFAGVFYKLAVFPFHFWTPDVYQGASNETAALVASLPKIGAVALLVRFGAYALEGSPVLSAVLTVLAAASLLYGNLGALGQTDVKRLLAFSGMAHGGFILIGFVALTEAGFTAALFTVLTYVLMMAACFLVLCRVSVDGRNVAVKDLAGLHRRSPLLALTLAAGVFGLAGIPPLSGFMGKLSLLRAALTEGHHLLALVAVATSAIAVFYYLRLIREAYFRAAPEKVPPLTLSPLQQSLCVVLCLGIVGLGIWPQALLDVLAVTPFIP